VWRLYSAPAQNDTATPSTAAFAVTINCILLHIVALTRLGEHWFGNTDAGSVCISFPRGGSARCMDTA